MEKISYIKGKRDGLNQIFNEKGLVRYEVMYKNGESIGLQTNYSYHDTGALRYLTQISTDRRRTGSFKAYFEDGTPSAIGEFNEKGHREGLWTYFYEDGSIKDKVEYKDGEKLTNPK